MDNTEAIQLIQKVIETKSLTEEQVLALNRVIDMLSYNN